MSLNFSFPFVNTPAFYSGTNSSTLVPDVFPVAINGRPYMIDQKSGEFGRGYEQRVRDSQDVSTAPGEAAINPGGLWRRGEVSWHLGAGQKYSDTADAQDYRFFRSKGVNPWTKGQLSLLNATKSSPSLSTSSTNLFLVVVESAGTEYLYVADGSTLKYSTNPFASSPTWTSVTTGSPGTAITGLETNGTNVFIAYTNNDIYYTTPGSASVSLFYPTSGTTGKTYSGFGYAKGWGIASVDNELYVIGLGSGGHTVHYSHPDTAFRWVGAAGGQNAVYAAGYSGDKSIIYKMTLKADASGLDQPIAALELPLEEVVSSIYGYLGGIFLGTNKGVRYCTTDSQNNLVAGQIIPTPSAVYDFIAEDKYIWFGWSNYDGASSGLGRLDLSQFVAPNTPAYATDLMHSGTSAAVKSVTEIADKRVFSIAGVGVIVEDADNLVAEGTIETGIYRWGIPDRKFIARVDTRSHPLKGSVKTEMSLDEENWIDLGLWNEDSDVENSFPGSETRAIEAKFKFTLNRGSATTGPTLTRWTARAYAAPFRSEVFVVPVLLHEKIRARDKDHYFDVDNELSELRNLIAEPRIISLQIGKETASVIVEDLQWRPSDARDRSWLWEGTAVVTMRSVQE